MITLRITRTEDDGRETELGEVRMQDGRVFSSASTPDGMHVVPQIVNSLTQQTEPAQPFAVQRRTADGLLRTRRTARRRFDA